MNKVNIRFSCIGTLAFASKVNVTMFILMKTVKIICGGRYEGLANVLTYRDRQGQTKTNKDREGQKWTDKDKHGRTGPDRAIHGQTGTEMDKQGQAGTSR